MTRTRKTTFALGVAGFLACAVGWLAGTAAPRALADDKAGDEKATLKSGVPGSNEKLQQPERIEKSYPLAEEDARKKSTELLQQLVVDLLTIFDDYKQAHWNMTGPLYLVLHEYYQEQADYYRLQADVFAERALHLGYSVDGRFSTVAKTTTIPDMPAGFLTDNQTLQLLVDRVTVLQKEVYKGIEATEKTDAPTSNKLQDLAYALDKNLWQLRAHIERPGSLGDSLPWAPTQGKGPAPKGAAGAKGAAAGKGR